MPNCDIPKTLKDNGLTFYSYTDRTHIQFFTLSTLVELVETGGFKIVESGFINEVGLRNLMLSALLFEGVKGRLSKSYIKKCGMDESYMTLYVVAEIEGGDFGS